MYIICGLGNPGNEYSGSRHNVGFETIDILADRLGISCSSRSGKSLVGSSFSGGTKILLMKPQTYMNLSGEAVREQVDYFKIDPSSELIVINDDIDLDPGSLRIRKNGSAGGHNGLKNIILHLGTEDFIRIRIGVGAKPSRDYDLADHVLGHPKGDDAIAIAEGKENASLAALAIISDGLQPAMNRYNTKKKKKAEQAQE